VEGGEVEVMRWRKLRDEVKEFVVEIKGNKGKRKKEK